jgi:alkylhydroperoxidase family enzyme
MAPYLSPIDNPSNPLVKLMYRTARKKFGVVPTPWTVFTPRMPLAFTTFMGKVSRLDKKLVLPHELAVAVRAQVANTTGCAFCQDAARWFATLAAPELDARFEALWDYTNSSLFTDRERAALDYATELARDHHVEPETFERLARYFSEREICDLVWLVASEHLYNISNIGLGIGSDGLCQLRGGSAAVEPRFAP